VDRIREGHPTTDHLEAELERARVRVAGLEAELARHEDQAAVRARQLERYAADLRETFKEERSRSQELKRSYRATVRALANAVEARDAYTGKHAERVAAYGLELGRVAGLKLTDAPEIEFGFLLHDVGKVAVPDAILFKDGRLTNEEFALMRQHPVVGWEILREIDFLGDAKLVVRNHHERWDGAGYPDGLAGDDIPLPARVFSVADTLDALTTDRPYRAAGSLAEAREIIRAEADKQFDPMVVEALEEVSDERFLEIRQELG
jgi:HD-GYP domain-containing protein (c-di-GMP phosphodiesterase class II)